MDALIERCVVRVQHCERNIMSVDGGAQLDQELTPEQIRRAIEALNEYLAAPPTTDGRTRLESDDELNRQRVEIIKNEILPLLGRYLAEEITMPEFKRKVDGTNKQNELWGFRGIKGQMFFNMVVKVADGLVECDRALKAAIKVPNDEEMASSRINAFSSYVKRIGDHHVELGGTKHGVPKLGSVPFFLSYFWQIQQRDIWPVFYTSSVNAMTDMNLWRPTADLATDYVMYKHIYEELARIFSKETKRDFGLYDVEHVFWFKSGKPYVPEGPTVVATTPEKQPSAAKSDVRACALNRLPESYVPPVVAILPSMAANEPGLDEAAKESGTSLVRAFEKSINAAFTILGYETKLLGQGKGRVPDGQALALDDSYAILWDAKVRSDSYNMGTDDRTIKEYIVTQNRELKKRRGLRNIYYLVISSHFADDYDDAIRSLKMETDVNEVCLVEADALVVMVDAKLRAQNQVTLGPDGLQRLFSVSGILSAQTVQQTLD